MLSFGFRMQVFNLPIWCKFTAVLTVLLDSNVQVLGSNVQVFSFLSYLSVMQSLTLVFLKVLKGLLLWKMMTYRCLAAC